MSALDDLIKEIPDENLRKRINEEFNKLKATKKFGLVFQEQKPEVTPLYDMPIKKNALVAKKIGKMNELYKVIKIDGEDVECIKVGEELSEKIYSFTKNELVNVALFGEPIYPYLQKLDEISNAPDSDLWHTLIEADNYHALQLLQYVCADRKVDCIYIDPPYNTGAKDWKYNNDYVDGNDEYRHSKWLSMMEKRLKLAKKILNPADSVLIVTIDEKEYLHLGCMLEEIFPESAIQMISTVINPAGVSRNNQFARLNEYIFFVMFGACHPEILHLSKDWQGNIKGGNKEKLHWNTLQRSGTGILRKDRPNMFYPIYINKTGTKILGAGDSIPLDINRDSVNIPDDVIAVFPIFPDGREGRWRLGKETFLNFLKNHYVKLGNFREEKTTISYVPKGEQEKIENGDFPIIDYADDGSVIVDETNYSAKFIPGNQWWIDAHNATQHGTKLLNSIIGNGKFSFPKSLYAVRDCLKFFVANKPNALIVDFFAGSGTTMHAVNLLNAEDGGKRRCILVTNNEVAESEERRLKSEGYQPNDEEWQKLGIARYVTWKRTICSIKGENIKGEPLKGNYLGSEIPMADGFKTNAVFFKLGFLNKNAVALGRQFREILPVIWLKAGSYGKCPNLDSEKTLPSMMILPENKFAVLLDEKYFAMFEEKVSELLEIETIFIITDSNDGYTAMIQNFRNRKTYQLYRNYLENFAININ